MCSIDNKTYIIQSLGLLALCDFNGFVAASPAAARAHGWPSLCAHLSRGPWLIMRVAMICNMVRSAKLGRQRAHPYRPASAAPQIDMTREGRCHATAMARPAVAGSAIRPIQAEREEKYLAMFKAAPALRLLMRAGYLGESE